MTYAEQLAEAKKITPNISEIMVAWEVEGAFPIDHPDFESICSLVEDYWVHSEYATMAQIVWAVEKMINSEHIAIDDISRWDITDYIEW